MTKDEINAEAIRIVEDAGVVFSRALAAHAAIVALCERSAPPQPKPKRQFKSDETRAAVVERARQMGLRQAALMRAGAAAQ